MIVRIGQVLISFPNVTLEREGVDEGAGQNAMFSVFVSLSPFVFDTQSGRSSPILKLILGESLLNISRAQLEAIQEKSVCGKLVAV